MNAKIVPIMAPSPAPEDIPNINGSAIGFLKTDCMTAPAEAKAEPTSIHIRTLGNLKLIRMVSLIFSAFPLRTFRKELISVCGSKIVGPKHGAITKVIITAASKVSKIFFFFKYFWMYISCNLFESIN